MIQKSNDKNIKLSITVFLLFLTVQLVTAQSLFTLQGIVNDGDQPIPYANVVVKGLNKGTLTEENGFYTLSLPKGKYTIVFSTIENGVEKNINLTKDTILNVNLENNFLSLNEVLVSAVRVKSDAPVTHTNLSKKEASKRNLGQDIPALLNYMPSVISSSDAGAGIGYTYLRVRGSDGTRINVTVNGIPYNDAESQGTFWVNMGDFTSSTESLQLQRGVGTSTNGSGAFGASLNILTDKISEKANGEISNSFGSYNSRKHTVKISTGKLNDHFEISGRLSKIYSDGYIDRAFTDLKSYFLQANYFDDNTLVKALVFGNKEQTYQAWYGITADQLKEDRRQNPYTYDNETDNYWQDHYQLHWNEKINNNWSTNIGLNYTKGEGYFEQYLAYDGDAAFNNMLVGESDAIVRRWLDNDFYVGNFNVNYTKQNLEIISGASYSNYTGDHFGELIWSENLAPDVQIRDHYYFNDAEKNDISIFSKATFSVSSKLKAFVDLQGRFIHYTTEGSNNDGRNFEIDENYNFFNPKVGVTFLMNDFNNLYFSYARANREPNRDDFKNGVNQHESLNDYELGWRYSNKKVKFNVNGYFMQYQNQLVLTGEINDVGAAIRANSGESYRLGLEIDADVKLTRQLMWRPNLALSTNKNVDFVTHLNGELVNLGETNISFSPNIIAGNIITYQPISNLSLSLLSKYVGEQYMSNIDEAVSDNSVLDDYFVSDFNINYTFNNNKIFDSIVLKGLINNIFNEEYVNRGYYGTYDVGKSDGRIVTYDYAGYYPQATINFLVGVTLNF